MAENEIIYPHTFATNKTYEVGQFGDNITYCKTEEFIIDIFKKLENVVDKDTSTSSSAIKSTAKEYIREARDSVINYLKSIEGGLSDYIITGIQYAEDFDEDSYSRMSFDIAVSLVKKAQIQEWLPVAKADSSVTSSWHTSGSIYSSLGMTPQTSYALKKGAIEGFLIYKPSYNSKWKRSDYTDSVRQVSQGYRMATNLQYYSFPTGRAYYMAFYASQINTSGGTPEYNPSGKEDTTSGKYPSSEMGGLGTFDDSTDLSDISTKPIVDISNLGFFSVWNPSAADLRNLAAFVWNNPTNISEWPKIFQSGIIKPLDYIIDLSMLPISTANLSVNNETFVLGGIPFNGGASALGITLNMNKIKDQIVDVDMGEISLLEYFGSFLDYAPYSTVSLYLPYYGTVQLSMNEIQNTDSIKVLYRINILDGSTVIKVHLTRTNKNNGSVDIRHVLYEYNTNLKTSIPLTSGANTEQLKTIATIITGATIAIAAPIAGAGASALAGAGAGAGAAGAAGAGAGAEATGQAVSGAIKAGAGAINKTINTIPSGGGINRGNLAAANFGMLGERRPFLIITRPIQILPADFGHKKGYSANITAKIGDLKGYIQTDNFKMQGTEGMKTGEIAEIESLLNSGVYI